MRLRESIIPLVLAVVVAVVALPAAAQTTGAIDGVVSDANDAPLPGASVELRSPSLQGIRTAVTSSAGRFRFPVIPPGIYTVTAALAGFKKVERNGVKVDLDATASVLIRMEISVTQEIVVTGEMPVVDTTSTTSGINIRQEDVGKMPLGRNYASAVQINPGVSLDTADPQGRAGTYSIYGATSIENQYLVDGINTTNVIRGLQSKSLTQEFVEEVQVKAGGYEAEYGRAMGGIINVVTKSGGNEFKGDVFGYFNSKSLTADQKRSAATDEDSYAVTSAGLQTPKRNIEDFGADLGGFILKDRIWFFGAYNRVHQDVDQVTLAGTGLPKAGVNQPISFSTDLFSGKLTVRPTDSTTIVGTIFGDPEVQSGALRNFGAGTNSIGVPATDATTNGTQKIGATDFAVGLTQIFGSTGLADVRYSQHRDRIVTTPDFPDVVGYRDFVQDPNQGVYGGGFGNVRGYFGNNNSKRDALKATGSLFLSTHEIKGGVDYENNLTNATDSFTGGQIIRIYACSPSRCTGPHANDPFYFGHEFYTITADKSRLLEGFLPNGNTVSPRIYRLGFFVQDTWKVIPSLTIHAGLRYDQEDVRDGNGNEIVNLKVVDANGNVLQEGGQTFKLKNEWQPRIGIAWDPLKDGSTKVSAFYGRFYYALPTDLTVRSYGATVDARIYNAVSTATGAGALSPDPNILRGTFTQGGVNPEVFQDNLKGIYQDEFALGFEKALSPTFSIGARYTFRNLGRTIEDRCDIDDNYPESNNNTCLIINPGSSSPFSTGQGIHTCDGRDYTTVPPNAPPNDCTGAPTTNVAIPAAERKFHGVELVVKKRVGNSLWMQASYLWSHLYGNYDGEASVGQTMAGGQGQTDPGINADYDYPSFLKYAQGDLFLDRRHSFRFDGAYTAPFGLTFGLNAFLRSGAPISKYGYFNGGYLSESNFVTPRGTEGRLPWDYEVSAALSYGLKFSSVTVTLFAQGFNLINQQNVIGVDQNCTVLPPNNENASGPGSVTDCSVATNPGSANPSFTKVIWRGNPRTLRLGARVSF
jgi:hypothetical protein